MDSKEVFDALLGRVSPLTRQVILDWLVAPFVFQELLEQYSEIESAAVMQELTSYNVVVWNNGWPELDFHEVKL